MGCKVTREKQAGLTHYISLSFCVIGTAGHGMQTTFNYPRTIHHPTVNSACHLRIVCKLRHSSGGNMRKLYVSDSRLHRASSSLWWSIPLGSLLQPAKICKLKVTSCHPMIPLYVNQIEFGRFDYPSGFKKDVTVSSLSRRQTGSCMERKSMQKQHAYDE